MWERDGSVGYRALAAPSGLGGRKEGRFASKAVIPIMQMCKLRLRKVQKHVTSPNRKGEARTSSPSLSITGTETPREESGRGARVGRAGLG